MNDDKAMLLYHLVKSDEDWKTSADMIIGIINAAAEKFPAKPRILVLDIEGHRNSADGFDWDMMTLQRTVVMSC